MKLTTDQIRAVTTGALFVEEEADGIHFYKCTKRQEAAWYAIRDTLGARTKTTTGVRLDFHTSSERVTFTTVAGNKFEVHIDGVLRRQFLMEEGDPKTATLALTDPLGERRATHRFTLYFPAHTVGVLASVELDDGATLIPHAYDTGILFLGDSITQGWHSEYDSFSYANRVSAFFNAESVIQGMGGAVYHESTLDVLPFEPDTVIVAYGTNDFGYYETQDELRLHAGAYLARVLADYRGKRILVVTPIYAKTGAKAMGTLADCRRVIREEAERLGLAVVDGLTLVPPTDDILSDTVHPNDLGFSFYAEGLIKAILAS